MPTLTLQRASLDGAPSKPVQFTYEGGSPDEPGPRGVLLRMMIAIASNDFKTASALVTEKSRKMEQSPAGPEGDLQVMLGEATQEGEFTIIPGATKAGGQEMVVPFHIIKEEGEWRVDMATTIDKMMGGLMEAMGGMMETAMSGLAEGMGKAMEGIGEAMQAGLGGGYTSPHGVSGGSDAHPVIEKWRSKLTGYTGLFLDVTVDWNSFEAEEARLDAAHGPTRKTRDALIKDVLDELFATLRERIPKDAAFRTAIGEVKTLHLQRALRQGMWFDHDSATVTYTIGENMMGGPGYYGKDEAGEVLAGVLG